MRESQRFSAPWPDTARYSSVIRMTSPLAGCERAVVLRLNANVWPCTDVHRANIPASQKSLITVVPSNEFHRAYRQVDPELFRADPCAPGQHCCGCDPLPRL